MLFKISKNGFSFLNKIFQTDGGGGFINVDFVHHLECGILHYLSCPGILEQNGVVERNIDV